MGDRRGRVMSGLRNITVEPVLFCYMFASMLTFSAFLAITYDKSCLDLYNASLCDALDNNRTFASQHKDIEDDVQETASMWIMRSNIAITCPAVLSLLLWLGSLGDRVGRRVPLIVTCLSAVLYSVCNILNAVYMHWAPAFLMIGPVFSGFGGSYLAMLMAAYTYLTHLTKPRARMTRVGVAEAGTFLAGTVSVFVSGRLVDTLGYVPAFGIALACESLALLYILFLLPDIKASEDSQQNSRTCGASCHGVCLTPVIHMWRFVTTPRASRVKLHLVLLILVLDVIQLCTSGENGILLLYLKRSPRSWSYTTYGYFKGAENFTRGASVLLLLPLLKKVAHLRDTTLVVAGLLSKMAGLILLGLSTKLWMIFLVVGVACLQGFPSAGIRASLAGLVDTTEQGRLFGIVAASEGVISLLSTLLFNGLYPLTLDFYDGLCFQMAAVLVLICMFIVLWQHGEFKEHWDEMTQRWNHGTTADNTEIKISAISYKSTEETKNT